VILVSHSKNYRSELENVSGKGTPILPYLGRFLSDLTFAEDGSHDEVQGSTGKLVNWKKRELVSGIISEVNMFQQIAYNIPLVEPIHTFLTELTYLEDKELYELSLLRESPKK